MKTPAVPSEPPFSRNCLIITSYLARASLTRAESGGLPRISPSVAAMPENGVLVHLWHTSWRLDASIAAKIRVGQEKTTKLPFGRPTIGAPVVTWWETSNRPSTPSIVAVPHDSRKTSVWSEGSMTFALTNTFTAFSSEAFMCSPFLLSIRSAALRLAEELRRRLVASGHKVPVYPKRRRLVRVPHALR